MLLYNSFFFMSGLNENDSVETLVQFYCAVKRENTLADFRINLSFVKHEESTVDSLERIGT